MSEIRFKRDQKNEIFGKPEQKWLWETEIGQTDFKFEIWTFENPPADILVKFKIQILVAL